MVQRVVRQLRESGTGGEITVATSASQHDVILSQLGAGISVVTEPERRDTFPAIALAASWLAFEKGCSEDETVVVMPCDPFTEAGYFKAVGRMARAVEAGAADLVLMGIRPATPSSKFGYVVPGPGAPDRVDGADDTYNIYKVSRFTEKPDPDTAAELISEGAFWNGGVFAFRLGYMTGIVRRYVDAASFTEIRSRYGEFPKISFDYEVVEKARSVAVVPFDGSWKDLGTWNALTEELQDRATGNVIMDDACENTHVVNELEIPVMCIGTRNLVVAASYDGILVSDRDRSESIRSYADSLHGRPMYVECSWGEYRVLGIEESPDGFMSVTRKVTLRAGREISYRVHRLRSEVWTFTDGEGTVALDGCVRPVRHGSTVCIPEGTAHAVKALRDLHFIEIQSGRTVADDDFELLDWVWE